MDKQKIYNLSDLAQSVIDIFVSVEEKEIRLFSELRALNKFLEKEKGISLRQDITNGNKIIWQSFYWENNITHQKSIQYKLPDALTALADGNIGWIVV